jgi:hypothetical protein
VTSVSVRWSSIVDRLRCRVLLVRCRVYDI